MTVPNELIDPALGNITGKVIVTVNRRDIPLEMATLELTMESSEEDILAKVQDVIDENLSDADDQPSFTTRKLLELGAILVIPKPGAGR